MNLIQSTQKEIENIVELIQACTREMQSRGIMQWDDSYPSQKHLENDIEHQAMYALYREESLAAIIVMDDRQSPQYKSVNWKHDEQPILVVHRLAVHPNQHRNGIGQTLMQLAEAFARENGFKSIRLDAYKHNEGLQEFYKNLNYQACGEIPLEYTSGPFVCFEKLI